MLAFWSRLRDLSKLALNGHVLKVWDTLWYRAFSVSTSLGLRRDVSVPFAPPRARIPIEIRPLAATDDLSVLDPRAPNLSAEEAFWRLGQLRLIESGIPTCYVATTSGGAICYMQWLITAAANEQLRELFGNLYPVLGPDEALLEGAFTPENFRGHGIMGAAMSHIAEQATQVGARWVNTFVDEISPASAKGCLKAGFTPYVRRHETFRLFRREVSFVPIAQE